jgi:hypothetical protein
VTIVLGSRTGSELDTQVVGYEYKPGGPSSGEDPILLLPEQVAHFAPIPDPLAKYRGMSWLTPILNEIAADESASTHKRLFFENGAKLGYVVTLGEGATRPRIPTSSSGGSRSSRRATRASRTRTGRCSSPAALT